MAEIDPYSVLGVTRTASRSEIARAYRRLAKQHHPDAGAAPTTSMARINDAWHIVSEPARRARWDRLHTVVEPHEWTPVAAPPRVRPTPTAAPPSRMDSGWVAFGVVAAVALLVGVLMIGVSLASQPMEDRLRFSGEGIALEYPSEWILAPGSQTDSPEHRVLAHVVTFAVAADQLCTSFADPCDITGDAIPAGEASIVITAWEGGAPPIRDPVAARPFGLETDDVIGGQPAAFELWRNDGETSVAWWQLSPPGFPDRWIEVRAEIGGGRRPIQAAMLDEIQEVMESVRFEPERPAG